MSLKSTINTIGAGMIGVALTTGITGCGKSEAQKALETQQAEKAAEAEQKIQLEGAAKASEVLKLCKKANERIEKIAKLKDKIKDKRSKTPPQSTTTEEIQRKRAVASFLEAKEEVTTKENMPFAKKLNECDQVLENETITDFF